MGVEYKVTRWDVSCESADPTKVCSVILGVTATDSGSGKSAYKDERISVPCTDITEFEAGAEAFVEGVLGSRGWFLELQTRIVQQMTSPVAAPEDRVKPDFDAMSIGDGYSELPEEEEEIVEVVEEETTEDDTPPSVEEEEEEEEEEDASENTE